MKRLPPIEKIYEALSAVAAGRVKFESDPESAEGRATVTSSDGSRQYLVSWYLNTYSSNDNGTYWQGYPGYPIVAVMMLQGKIPHDERLAKALKGVNWREVNGRHHNDYGAALTEILDKAGIPHTEADSIARAAYSALERQPVTVSRSTLKPPK